MGSVQALASVVVNRARSSMVLDLGQAQERLVLNEADQCMGDCNDEYQCRHFSRSFGNR
jgi:hypothetical protein